jgi:hypothetical protein
MFFFLVKEETCLITLVRLWFGSFSEAIYAIERDFYSFLYYHNVILPRLNRRLYYCQEISEK